MKCIPKCEKDDITDDAQGNTYCTKCGTVLNSHNIVSDLQFTTSGAVGFFLNPSAGGQAAIFGGSKCFYDNSIGRGFQQDSRQMRLRNA
jgi:transcription factor IIIB subunit 2